MQDEQKIKKVIADLKSGKLNLNDDYMYRVYATYVYAVRSQALGHLHMKIWNKHHPKPMSLDTTSKWLAHPIGAGHFEFKTLDDQGSWIAYVRQFIANRQSSIKTGKWKDLVLDFEKSEEVVIHSDIVESAVVA
jgi:hypothetical protein